MPSVDQHPSDNNELLADISYLNQANRKEIERIRSSLRQRISNSDGTDGGIESVINEVSNELGRLTTNVKLTEKALRSIQPPAKSPVTVVNDVDGNDFEIPTQCFSASQLAGTSNLLPLENTGTGVDFSWTGSDPITTFTFDIDRSEAVELRIFLFCMIKRNYARKMRLFVDGKQVSHWRTIPGRKMVVGCKLPADSNSTSTTLKIVLPATYSPSEIGNSVDTRKLGIAISKIRFDKSVGAVSRLLMQLRLKQ